MTSQLRFETKKVQTADLGEESSIPDLLGESVLQNKLEFVLDEDDEIYEGYGRRENAYPYRKYDCYTRAFSEKELKTAVLENRYLKAVFLTEYGGRLWELWDKTTGKNLLYTNDVLLFGNLAVRNAWFSGGVEWNIGIIGHTPLTTEPMYVAETEFEDGTPVLRMYEYERIRRLTYQMDFWFSEEDKFLNCRMRVVNDNDTVVPMYWWSNIAVPEHENGRAIVPAQKAFTNREQQVCKVDIPYVDGVDITDYKQIRRSVDYFFDIPKNKTKYIANVNQDGYGLLHVSTDRLQSRKLFSWGNSTGSDRWQGFLTKNAGRYVEIQAGLGKTQYGCIPMAPHTVWEWMEQYGAVQIDKALMDKEHTDRMTALDRKLEVCETREKLNRKLAETKTMAHTKAKLISAGSGFGAQNVKRKFSAHLEFREAEELKSWKPFFATGIMPKAEVQDCPGAFLIDEYTVSFLETHMTGENEKNWYAHYHLGLGYYCVEKWEKAKREFETSLALAKNPWAYHALSCVCLKNEETKEAEETILAGMKLRMNDEAYLKEGFKILNYCKAYARIREMYLSLDEEMQKVERLSFYYICALHELGEEKEAMRLLEADGGLEMPDVREGEESVGFLWHSIHEKLYGETGEIPFRFDFKAF